MSRPQDQYLDTAIENELLARRIAEDQEATPDLLRWASTIAFYAAVHYVNAHILATWGSPPGNHAERENVMRMTSLLKTLLPEYLRLKDVSSRARYMPKSRVSRTELVGLLDHELATIADTVRGNFIYESGHPL
jgi:hypothetical protein